MVDGLVSIITSVYNSERFIAQAIESVQAQTYTNWEMIITDDCSQDRSNLIIESYASKDPRIRLFSLKDNGGPGLSRNNSIEHSNGQYIAFLDSDDKWAPDKLEKQLSLMKQKGCFMTYSSYQVCNEKGIKTGLVCCKSKVTYNRIVCDNAIGFLTLMYDQKALGTELLPTIRKRQDWGLNIKLLKKCRVAYGIKEPLATYRIRNNSVSRNKFSLIKYNIAIYNKILGFSKPMSVLLFFCLFIPFYSGKKILNYFSTIFS